MLRRTCLAAVALAAALTLAACNGDGEPAGESTWTPTATLTPTPTEPETFDPTKETAREFLRRWISTGDEIQGTGDPAPYRAIVTEFCKPCHSFADQVETIYDDGGFIKNEGRQIRRMKHEVGYQWRLTMSAGGTRYKESATGKVRRLDGGEYEYVVWLARPGGVWKVDDFESQELA